MRALSTSLEIWETNTSDVDVAGAFTFGNTANVAASYENSLRVFGRNTTTSGTLLVNVGSSATNATVTGTGFLTGVLLSSLNFSQTGAFTFSTGTGAGSFNGASTFTAAGTALTVTNNSLFSGTTTTTGTATFNGAMNLGDTSGDVITVNGTTTFNNADVTFAGGFDLNFSTTGSSINYAGTPNFFRRSDVDATQVGVNSTIAFGFPLLTTAERDALDVSPAASAKGMTIFNTTTNALNVYDGASWTGVGSGPWSTASNRIFNTVTTDNVVVGSSADLSAKLAVDGDTDEVQFLVQGFSTQTNFLAVFENSAGTDQLTISNTGDAVLAGDLAVNGGDITTTASTSSVLTTPTTVTAFLAATTLGIGGTTGTATINNGTITFPNATVVNINGTSPIALASTAATVDAFITSTTFNVALAATAVSIGASTGTATINNPVLTGPNMTTFNMNGASPSIASTSTGTGSLFNAAITAVNIGTGAALTVTVGTASSTVAFNGTTLAFNANSALKSIRPNAVVAGAGVAIETVGGSSPTGSGGNSSLTGGLTTFASPAATGGAGNVTGGSATLGRGGNVNLTSGLSTLSGAGDINLLLAAGFVGIAGINIGAAGALPSVITINQAGGSTTINGTTTFGASVIIEGSTNTVRPSTDTVAGSSIGTSSFGWGATWIRNAADTATVNLRASTATADGALAIGYDNTGNTVITTSNVSDALGQLDAAIAGGGSVTFTAGATIDSGTLVRVSATDTVIHAIATSEAATRVIGVAEAAIVSAATGVITTTFGGVIESLRLVNALTPTFNDELFLSDATGGRATTTAPTASGSVIKKVGIVKDASAYVTVTNPFVEAIFQPEPGTLIA
jgi:hypothetical protein